MGALMTRRIEAIGIGVVILVLAMSGWMIYRAGETKGATAQRLVDNAKAIKAADAIAAVQARANAALKKSADSAITEAKQSANELKRARAKVVVVGDTVKADGVVVNLPSVASLVRICETHADDDSSSSEKQQVLIAGLNSQVDDLMRTIALRDQRIHILEHEKNPRFGFKSGLAAGAAGTIILVKVGIQIVKAVGHR